jgi:hypothetical protein
MGERTQHFYDEADAVSALMALGEVPPGRRFIGNHDLVSLLVPIVDIIRVL